MVSYEQVSLWLTPGEILSKCDHFDYIMMDEVEDDDSNRITRRSNSNSDAVTKSMNMWIKVSTSETFDDPSYKDWNKFYMKI